jgi:molecular chaperone Hsp31 and glyoxalase 3
MLEPLKKLLVLSPKKLEDNSYSPSPMALKLATVKKTDFSDTKYENAYTGNQRKVLMICTEEKNMVMKNGKMFSTGNHPVVMLLPMLHLRNAGFDIDIITPTGKPVQIEMWAMPQEDVAIQNIFQDYKQKLENPGSVIDFVHHSLTETTPYIAVFLPGGHGAMLGLPDNPGVGKIIRWSHKLDLFMLALCHGPAALLAAAIDTSDDEFIYKGYKMMAFPDNVDKQTPWIGYMPGHMPWRFGERLTRVSGSEPEGSPRNH